MDCPMFSSHSETTALLVTLNQGVSHQGMGFVAPYKGMAHLGQTARQGKAESHICADIQMGPAACCQHGHFLAKEHGSLVGFSPVTPSSAAYHSSQQIASQRALIQCQEPENHGQKTMGSGLVGALGKGKDTSGISVDLLLRQVSN